MIVSAAEFLKGKVMAFDVNPLVTKIPGHGGKWKSMLIKQL